MGLLAHGGKNHLPHRSVGASCSRVVYLFPTTTSLFLPSPPRCFCPLRLRHIPRTFPFSIHPSFFRATFLRPCRRSSSFAATFATIASIIVTTPSARHTIPLVVYLRSMHGILWTSVHRTDNRPTDRPMLVCVMYVRCAHQAVVGDATYGGRRRPVGGSGDATRPQAQSLRDPRRVCLR